HHAPPQPHPARHSFLHDALPIYLLHIIDTTVGTQTYSAKQVASGEQLSKLIETARAVPVATHIKEYAVRLLLATHPDQEDAPEKDRKSTRLNSSHQIISYAVFCS